MDEPTNADIRAWARARGLAVADRGRLPAHVVAAYADAHAPADQPGDAHAADEAVEAPLPPAPVPPASVDTSQVDTSPRSPFAVTAPGAPPAAGPPPPYGQAPAPSTDGFAVTSLVLSLLGGGLIAVLFGVLALRRVRRSGRPGRGLAIAGIVVGAITALLVAGLVVAAVVGDAERDDGGAVTAAGDVSLDDLRVRDCTGALPEQEVLTLRVVPCSEPHTAEVFAVFALEGENFPGEDQARRFSEGGCDRELGILLGAQVETAPYELFYFSPTEESWSLGDRTVICLLTAPSGGSLTGSVIDDLDATG